MTKISIENKLSVIFEFTRSGYLKNILINAPTDREQATLEGALDRLIKPDHNSWIKRLLRRG